MGAEKNPFFQMKDGTGGVMIRRVGVNKAAALEQICNSLGWDQDGRGWMVFGDDVNDLEVLRWAEWSVSPKNAKDERAKAAAKEVSPLTNDEAFISDALERALTGQLVPESGRAAL